jgi:hypothetical protein
MLPHGLPGLFSMTSTKSLTYAPDISHLLDRKSLSLLKNFNTKGIKDVECINRFLEKLSQVFRVKQEKYRKPGIDSDEINKNSSKKLYFIANTGESQHNW